jgi:hypothetical protein
MNVEALDPSKDAFTDFLVLDPTVAFVDGSVFRSKLRPMKAKLGSYGNRLVPD